MGMVQRMAKQWRKEKRSMAARSVEEDRDQPVLCSSQVVTPASLAAKKHSYMFCQFVSPAVAHGGGLSDCMSK